MRSDAVDVLVVGAGRPDRPWRRGSGGHSVVVVDALRCPVASRAVSCSRRGARRARAQRHRARSTRLLPRRHPRRFTTRRRARRRGGRVTRSSPTTGSWPRGSGSTRSSSSTPWPPAPTCSATTRQRHRSSNAVSSVAPDWSAPTARRPRCGRRSRSSPTAPTAAGRALGTYRHPTWPSALAHRAIYASSLHDAAEIESWSTSRIAPVHRSPGTVDVPAW